MQVMGHDLNLNAMNYFEAVARLGGVSKAAEELGVSPSAVSQQIRQIEQQFGVRLFRREKRRLILTLDGERLFQTTTQAFRMMRDVRSAIQRQRENRHFIMRVSPSFAHIDTIKRLIDRGNVWFKFAGCYESSRTGGPEFADIAAVAREIVNYAPERVIWGTNWPHNLAKTTAEYPDDGALLDTVLGWVPDTARQKVLVDNPPRPFWLWSVAGLTLTVASQQ